MDDYLWQDEHGGTVCHVLAASYNVTDIAEQLLMQPNCPLDTVDKDVS